MTVTYPRTDIVTQLFFVDSVFRLMARQELIRTSEGASIGLDLGRAVWKAHFTTKPLENAEASSFEAMLDSLDGVIGTFTAFDVRHPYPTAYPDGVFSEAGVLVHTVTNAKTLRLKGLAAAFVLTRGDYLSIGGRLHRVAEAATAAGDGITPAFEVRPALHASVAADAAVVLKLPPATFRLDPESIDVRLKDALHTEITFSASQAT